MNWSAVEISLKLATLTSLILLLIGIPVAYWVTYSRWRLKFLVESIVTLPLVLPPTVLGFYILVSIGPRSPVGQWYQGAVGHPLPFSFEGLVLASIIYSLPFAVQPMVTSFSAVDFSLLEASWTLGVSPVKTFWRVVLPQSGRGLLTALVLTFAHTVGEFGVVLMVGGNIDGVTRTISIDIYDSVQALNYQSAAYTSFALLLFSFTVLAVVYGLNRRPRHVWSEIPR